MSVVGPLAVTEEQRALAETVTRYLADQTPLADVRASYGAAAGHDPAAWRGLAELGVVGALAPERSGGLGLALADLGGVLEAAGRALYAGPLAATAVATMTALIEADDPLLGQVIDGSTVVAVMAGVECAPANGRVSVRADFVPYAAGASAFLLLTGDGCLLVPTAEGVHVEPTPTIDGSRCAGTVVIDEAPVRKLAADPQHIADRFELALCADGYGAAATALEAAIDYAQVREQFGQPIGSFQALQHLLVDAFATLRVAGLAIREALDSPTEERVAATVATCRDGLAGITATALHVFGGIGYSWESDVHLFHKRCLGLQTMSRSEDTALDRVADQVMQA